MTDKTRDASSLADSLILDRRDFCGKLAIAAAGTFIAGTLPLARVTAGEISSATSKLDYGSVDDMVCGYPSYAEPIDYGRAHVEAAMAIDDAGTYWV